MVEPIRKIYGGAVLKDGSLNDREIRVVASDATVDRAGDVVVPSGCKLDSFAKNPIVLANHSPEHPIGTAQATIQNNRVEALVTFAPPGLSRLADEWCGLAKAKILNAVSIGFTPIESEPIRGGGTRFTEWELLELSFVSVPANPNAVVIARGAPSRGAKQPSPDSHLREFLANLEPFTSEEQKEYEAASERGDLVTDPRHRRYVREFILPGLESTLAEMRRVRDNFARSSPSREALRSERRTTEEPATI